MVIKSNKHIEIVRSEVKGLSSMSEESSASILTVLRKNFSRVGITTVNNLADLEGLVAGRPDLVFLGMELIPSESALGTDDFDKIWLSDFLDAHQIAYTGSGRKANELGRNKPMAKQCILDASLRTPAFYVAHQNQPLDNMNTPLPFPLFVKPTNRGGGVGIDSDSVVNNFEQLSNKVQSITTNLQTDALIEEYLPGREFSVAILKDDLSDEYLAMPIELIAPSDKNGVRLLSSQVKSSNVEQALEVIDEDIRSKVMALALAAFNALGASDFGRIDIRLDADDVAYFLEANLIPSLISGYGSFPKACLLNLGLDYEPMIMRIASLGLARQKNVIQEFMGPIIVGGSPFPSSEAVFDAV